MKRWIAMLCMWLLPWPAWGWGQEGHSIVAELAQRRLSQPASAYSIRSKNPKAIRAPWGPYVLDWWRSGRLTDDGR